MEYTEEEKIAAKIIPNWIEQFNKEEIDKYNITDPEACMVADFRANIGLSRTYSEYELRDWFSYSKLKTYCRGCEKYGRKFYGYTWRYPIKYWRASYLLNLQGFLDHMSKKHGWKQ